MEASTRDQRPARLFVFDDDPTEHMIFQSLVRKTRATIDLLYAQTEEELRSKLPDADADLLMLDNCAPPFFDYRDSAVVIRNLGFVGPIVVMSSLVDTSTLSAEPSAGVVEICDKAQLSPAFLDELLARHTPRGAA